MTLNCNGKLINLGEPVVIGVINLTKDSFYSGSRLQNDNALIEKCKQMIQEGAQFIELGAQSTRPGSLRVSARDEVEVLLPAIQVILASIPGALLSIDTYHSEVAIQTIAAGAAMINDISSGEMDPAMIAAVATLSVPYVCMHMRGEPQNMQQHAGQGNIAEEVLSYFIEKKQECKNAGIKDLILDPGFGFGKNIHENFVLLQSLSLLKMLNCPVMAGLSRKSTIYKTLNTTPENALNGTTVLNTIALSNGAHILRVHDVKEAVETIQLWQAYSKTKTPRL
ncbi:MAG: dihydropteroate synthase [Bacteroidetes bacterium]|nr:dihydropteroate synthase [Bacteroidota bacterium]